VQTVELAADAMEPLAHAMHTVAVLTLEYAPAEHTLHADEFAAAANEPAVQLSHAVAASTLL